MRALDRKLFRDLGRMKSQAAAIALVLASGVALFVGAAGTYRSLRVSQHHYYSSQRFIEVRFNGAEREDLAVSLAHPKATGTVAEFRGLPGVVRAEPFER